MVAFAGIAIPDKILTIPILAAFAVSLAHFIALYRLRVAIPLGQMIGAVFAAMSVQWTVARAVGFGVWKESLPFMRTAKGGATRKGPDFPAFWEAVMAALLLIGAAIVVVTNYKQIHEINIFAAGAGGAEPAVPRRGRDRRLEGSRFNEFAYWRSLEAKVAALPRPRRRRRGPGRSEMPADKHVEYSAVATAASAAPIPTACGRSARQRRFHQLHPVRGADRDRLVVEIVGRVVQAGAVAVADEDEGAGPRLQHEGEILRAHHRRDASSTRSWPTTSAATAAANAACRSWLRVTG